MSEAYLLIGGNLGNRYQNILDAGERIEKLCGKILKSSKVYETAAWGNIHQPDFLNQVLQIQTSLQADQLMAALLTIEKEMGRIRNEKFGARTIDLDILFYDSAIIDNQNVTIPHPKIAERCFVLVPLSEIAPDLIHPVLQKNINSLLVECPDKLEVRGFFPNVHKNELLFFSAYLSLRE